MIKFPFSPNQFDIILKTQSHDKLCHLLKIINQHSNIIVTGKSGSGKTELAKIIPQLYPDDFVIFTNPDYKEWDDATKNSLVLRHKDTLNISSQLPEIIMIDEIPNGHSINLFHQVEKLTPDSKSSVMIFSQRMDHIPKELVSLMESSNKTMCKVFTDNNFIDKIETGCPDNDI